MVAFADDPPLFSVGVLGDVPLQRKFSAVNLRKLVRGVEAVLFEIRLAGGGDIDGNAEEAPGRFMRANIIGGRTRHGGPQGKGIRGFASPQLPVGVKHALITKDAPAAGTDP